MIFLMWLILKYYFLFCNLKIELWSFVIFGSLEINPDVRKTKAFNHHILFRGREVLGQWVSGG